MNKLQIVRLLDRWIVRKRLIARGLLVLQLSSYLAIQPSDVFAGDHDYFNAMTSRSDHWKSYSFRDNVYDNGPNSKYDPAHDTDPHKQDAMKLVIPTFRNHTPLPHALSATDTVITWGALYATNWQVKPHDGNARYARIGSEIMMVVDSDREATTVTYQRGNLGTQAVPHSAGEMVQLNGNSLQGQVRVPLLTEDNNTYLFTWDGYWTDSYLNLGVLTNHKCFQFSSGSQDGDAIWLEVDTRFGSATNPLTDVAFMGMRSYNHPNTTSESNWALTDGNAVGPIVTEVGNLAPMAGAFNIKPNTWSRFWVRIEQRANDFDYMDFWVADANNDPVQIYEQLPISVRPDGANPNVIKKFWLEFNTSVDYLTRMDYRDMVAYVRNFVALKNPPSNLANIFQRPGSSVFLPPLSPSAPKIIAQPASVNVGEGNNVTFAVSATGTNPKTYQWQSIPSGGNSFSNLTNGTGLTYVFDRVRLTQDGTQVRCIITNSLGTVTSAVALLRVSPAGGTPPPPPPPPTSGGTPPPPPPPTSGLVTPTLRLPDFLPVNAQITVGYAGATPASFDWTFTPVTGAPSAKFHAPIPAAHASFNTPSPTASLATAGLDLGTYLVTVTARDSSGTTSSPASARVTLVSANLDQVRIYPNPWRSDRHSTRSITFGNLTVNTEVKIFTVSGQHVRTLPISSNQVDWDLKNESGDKVASGIYLYVLKADDGSKRTGKVVVIK
jgi:hypothetical protein